MAPHRSQSASLPSGTVTLLFADVEGSTRLLHALGEAYGPLRARARELVRTAASTHGGHEVDWAGDGVFLAFESARNAISAAADLQRGLADEPWPPEARVRMRIGLHTGEPKLEEEGYLGIDVHVAARICSAAHGGQIVVSRATRDFVGDDAPEGASFRPLGSHRLKDVSGSHQLFQLVVPELESSFPPLQTLGGATLPMLHHRLVGRRDDLDRIEALLARPDVRLVTITGPGGAGKSRLALEVAATAALERPVHLVGLAPISDPGLVLDAIARTLGARETPGRSLADAIADVLAGSGTLLVLDNLEHLAHSAQHIGELLNRIPKLDVLTTSRAPLRLSGEHVVPLEPLEIDDAATLFTELAAARGVVLHENALASVREICRRLDGLPLAIELVAARLVVLPPSQVLQALEAGLALDMEGPIDLPERQRTLRTTIDWSYGLLDESQKELHGALAVFAGGCTFDDAQAIAGAKAGFLADLESLVAWSLLRSDVSDGEVRLSMLETVREDAVERLASEGKLDELQRRHAERFLERAAAAEAELAGPEQAVCLKRLEREFDNLRMALDWALTNDRVSDALRAIAALERFWRAYGHVSEARRWLSLGLARTEGVPVDLRADALWTAAQQASAQYDWNASVPLLEEALELFRKSDRGREVVFALSDLGFVALMQHDPERAIALDEEALRVARELGDGRAISAALLNLGEVLSLQGESERALAHYEEAVRLRRALGDPLLVANVTYNLGVAAYRAGDTTRARGAIEESLVLAREIGEDTHTAAALYMVAELELLDGSIDLADDAIRESLAVYTELDNDSACAGCLVLLAEVSTTRGSLEEAARLVGAAESLRGDAPVSPFAQTALERFLPELETGLGRRRLAGLTAEGQRLGRAVLTPEFVSASTRQ